MTNLCSSGHVLQIRQNKIRHHRAQVLYQERIRDAVARLWIEHQLKLLPGFLQFINQLNRIRHVHVVVSGAVD